MFNNNWPDHWKSQFNQDFNHRSQIYFQTYMATPGFIPDQNGQCFQTRRKRYGCFCKFCVFFLCFLSLMVFIIIDAVSGNYRALGLPFLFIFILLASYIYRRRCVKDDQQFTTCILSQMNEPRYCRMPTGKYDDCTEGGSDIPGLASGSGFCTRSSQDERLRGSLDLRETRLSVFPFYDNHSDSQFNRELGFDTLVDQPWNTI